MISVLGSITDLTLFGKSAPLDDGTTQGSRLDELERKSSSSSITLGGSSAGDSARTSGVREEDPPLNSSMTRFLPLDDLDLDFERGLTAGGGGLWTSASFSVLSPISVITVSPSSRLSFTDLFVFEVVRTQITSPASSRNLGTSSSMRSTNPEEVSTGSFPSGDMK